MTDWQKLTRRAKQVADRTFGEPVRFSFFKGGIVDAEREPIDIVAQVHLPGEGDINLAKAGLSFSTKFVGGSGLVIVQRAALNQALAQGDQIRLTDRPGAPWCPVISIDGRDPDQLAIMIGPANDRKPKGSP